MTLNPPSLTSFSKTLFYFSTPFLKTPPPPLPPRHPLPPLLPRPQRCRRSQRHLQRPNYPHCQSQTITLQTLIPLRWLELHASWRKRISTGWGSRSTTLPRATRSSKKMRIAAPKLGKLQVRVAFRERGSPPWKRAWILEFPLFWTRFTIPKF